MIVKDLTELDTGAGQGSVLAFGENAAFLMHYLHCLWRLQLNVEPDCSDESAEAGLRRSGSDHSLELAGSRTLWQADPPPADSHKYYHFTRFAMSLNELQPEMELCRTDSR